MRSNDGYVYLTPDDYVSGGVAQKRLALPKTPTGYFRISGERVRGHSMRKVAPANGQPGGGNEILVPYTVYLDKDDWVPIGP